MHSRACPHTTKEARSRRHPRATGRAPPREGGGPSRAGTRSRSQRWGSWEEEDREGRRQEVRWSTERGPLRMRLRFILIAAPTFHCFYFPLFFSPALTLGREGATSKAQPPIFYHIFSLSLSFRFFLSQTVADRKDRRERTAYVDAIRARL